MEELDHRSVCRKTGVSPEAEMDVVTRVELECSYGAGDGQNRSGVASMPKERSGGPRLDRSCNWEKYGYDTSSHRNPASSMDQRESRGSERWVWAMGSEGSADRMSFWSVSMSMIATAWRTGNSR